MQDMPLFNANVQKYNIEKGKKYARHFNSNFEPYSIIRTE